MRKTEKLADNWTEETVEYVSGIVSAAHRFQSAYLQTPPEHASNRRSLEKYYTYPEIEWIEGGRTYTASYEVKCSCRHIYASGEYSRDGYITNLTAIRNSLKRMRAALADNKKTA